MKPSNLIAIALASSVFSLAASPHPILEPGAYELHPGFELSLFAAEPDVVDPVALTFDEQGRVFVIEMRDYPDGINRNGKPGGTIRLLEDTNGDGKADRSVLFADNLSFPTSIAPWKNGVIVTAPPEIIYLKDTDGDGRADHREVLFSGFRLGVTDSNVNGLRWGLDNRLHGVNGGNDGVITSMRRPGSPAVSVRKLDFSFDPETGDFLTTTHTSGGFGLVFDDWGHSFSTYNINHIQQRIIPVRYLQRLPGLPPLEGVMGISDHGEMARIFPVAEPETRPNHPEQSGHFSAAGGMGFGGVAGLPGDVAGSVFVCDVVGHVIHRDVLTAEGPTFIAKRSAAEQTNEFFAARDPAFRPVGLELGPDGALYLLDMQRDVIEHPDYIPEKVLSQLNLRAGEDRGRIYRLSPKGASPVRTNLAAMSSAELVACLGQSNQWRRMTAQRLLVERRDLEAIPMLKERAALGGEFERLHALWTLRGCRALNESLILQALRDVHPGVRENALLLAEGSLASSIELQHKVVELTQDPSPRVRFQAALSMGEMDSGLFRSALGLLWRRDFQYHWTRIAILSSLRSGEAELLVSLLNDATFRRDSAELKLQGIRELADLCGARSLGAGATNPLASVLTALGSNPGDRDSVWSAAAFDGWSEGLKRASGDAMASGAISNALQPFLRSESPRVLTAAWRLARALHLAESPAQRDVLSLAMKRAKDRTVPTDTRVGQTRLLAFGNYATVGETLVNLLVDSEPAGIQEAAVAALSEHIDPGLASRLVERWRSLQPSVRPQVLALLLQRVTFHDALLSALESGRVTLGELNLDLEQRRRLLRKSSPGVMARAAKWIGDGEYSNRKELVGEWLKKLPATGNADRGQQTFVRLCASCHSPLGSDRSVGPNLASVAHRSVEDLVSNILDPNMAINPNYVTYMVETRDGEVYTGVLQSESPENVVLLQALGRRSVIQRKDIHEMRSTGVSLMPEGLEAGLEAAGLRDLVAYVQSLR